MARNVNTRFPSKGDQKLQQSFEELGVILDETHVCALKHNIGAGTTAATLKNWIVRAHVGKRASRRPIALGVFGPSQDCW